MKVILINGSPHEDGSTKRALMEVALELTNEGFEYEILQLSKNQVMGCTACGACNKLDKCIFNDVNEWADRIADADGLIIGTPVYYANPNGALIAMLDRLFYSAGRRFYNKPAAAVACARRAGTTASLDVINKYFMISNMPVVSSCYWNMAFGTNKNDVEQDEEGKQIMRGLARNMAWLIKSIESGKKAGISLPKRETKIKTNYIK